MENHADVLSRLPHCISSATLQVLLVGKERILLAIDELAFFPSSLAYSCFLTLSSASPMRNLSNRMAAAWEAFLFVDFRNGFHISITARRTGAARPITTGGRRARVRPFFIRPIQ